MSKKQKQQLSQLRKERGLLVAELVQAQRIHDDLRAHRISFLQRELATLNDKMKEVQV